jgi:glutamate-1-semialdehyde 2,1-aminomutase
VQKLARQHGILFILDETVTGFRVAPGGCQEYYKLEPDIVTFGKALGSGLPVAAFAGCKDVMSALEWGGVLHYGTHNGSRIGMHAARANLRVLTRNGNAAFRHIWRIADQLAAGLAEVFKRKGRAVLIQRVGPMFQLMFTERQAILDYREFSECVDRAAYRKFVHKLFEFGVYTTPSAALHSIVTLAHTDEDISLTLSAVERALDALSADVPSGALA